GELVVRVLKGEGVRYLFSLSGGHINPIYDACLDARIQVIDVRHEQAAALMAEGWALSTGQPGVCCITAGPGITNAVSGVANAYLSGVPLIALGGSSPLKQSDMGSLQDMDQMSLMRPITKWSRVVHEPERIPEYMAMAFRHALSGRPGPVYLEIPWDVIYRQVEEREGLFPIHYRTSARPGGDPDRIEEALKLLAAAQRPVLIAGSGSWWSGAAAELKEFVERTKVPALTLNAGRGILPDDHPLCFGPATPFYGGELSQLVLQQADLILLLGSRLLYTLLYGRFHPQARVIQVDLEASEIGRNRPIDVGIVGDAAQVLQQLTQGAPIGTETAWHATLRETKRAREERLQQLAASDALPMHPLRLCREIRDFLDKEAIVVCDGGDISAWANALIPAYTPGSRLTHGPLGCLGIGLPYAIAAKLAHPDRPVLLITGDGSFGLNGMEFDTAIRHQIPIVCVIGNDEAWGMIKHSQAMTYGASRIVGSQLGVRHYERMVEGLGGYGEFVTAPREIRPALERAFASGKPACVNVMTDPQVMSEGLKFLASAM
ncbi:MAG: thiamine pyrophosphate-binding protein, partial [Candidatus Tectomicrobia bacterium]|nr:thiamine pyrophosphate-binding protein [Candidatus Tectomicrobia bacterium]